MRENWETPRTIIEHFVPNEYIATCKDKWTVKCNVNRGLIFEDMNMNGEYDPLEDKIIIVTSGCGEEFDITGTQGQLPPPNAFFFDTETEKSFPVFYEQDRSTLEYHVFRPDRKGDYHPKNLS